MGSNIDEEVSWNTGEFCCFTSFFASKSILILTVLWPKLLHDIAAVSLYISDQKSSKVLGSNIDEEVSWNTGDFCCFTSFFVHGGGRGGGEIHHTPGSKCNNQPGG